MSFDRPFFGAIVVIPMSIAAVFDGVISGCLRLSWYWSLLICLLILLGMIAIDLTRSAQVHTGETRR